MVRAWVAAVCAGVLAASLPASASGSASGSAVTVSSSTHLSASSVQGWLGNWHSQATLSSVAAKMPAGSSVSVFWAAFNSADDPLCVLTSSSGCTSAPAATALAGALPAFQSRGVDVFGTVVDYSPKLALSKYLSTRSTEYAARIADAAQRAGLDGVDLDFENFAFVDGSASWPVTKPLWVSFVKELSAQLRERGLKFSVTVPAGLYPFTSSGSPNPGAGYGVYAWAEIVGFVDEVRIMAYDYSVTSPGPVGPDGWADRVVASALAQVGSVNASKLRLGVAQYGRNWLVRSASTGYVTRDCPSSWVPDPAMLRLTHSVPRVLQIAARERVSPAWDDATGEFSFAYDIATAGTVAGSARTCTAARKVYFSGTASAVSKSQIASKYRLGGVAVWELGLVGPDFFSRVPVSFTATVSRKGSRVVVSGRVFAPGASSFRVASKQVASGVVKDGRFSVSVRAGSVVRVTVFSGGVRVSRVMAL